ncbi:MAG: TfoX/Sxy family protein [Crocinitomicaceae bacterium]|nr:TfoX/Sxy family protein [Crocinitomicaceae bacterium]MDP4865123.1 TfoX/Sxy family protein [Crocinitomicaceae bacterium]
MNSDYRTIKQKMIDAGITPHFLMFYSIEMGLQDRKWNDISPTEKQELKRILGM